MAHKHESSVLTFSTNESIDARKKIFDLMHSYEGTEEEKERSLGLFLRGALLARILAITDIYRQITSIPGIVFDIGTWRGQTAVICENLRAIYEPLHFNRRIICFDTFTGYEGFSDKDLSTDLHQNGTYSLTGKSYADFLADLLRLHEISNAMGHNNGKHRVITGDCQATIPDFFKDNPGEIISLAFFDVNAYKPTLSAFENVWNRLAPGGIIAFWQLTRNTVPAEGMVYAENILQNYSHDIKICPTYPGLCYIKKLL